MALLFWEMRAKLFRTNLVLSSVVLPLLPVCWPSHPRGREEARRAIGDVLASSWAPKRSHRPVAPPSAPPRAATVRPPVLAYTG